MERPRSLGKYFDSKTWCPGASDLGTEHINSDRKKNTNDGSHGSSSGAISHNQNLARLVRMTSN